MRFTSGSSVWKHARRLPAGKEDESSWVHGTVHVDISGLPFVTCIQVISHWCFQVGLLHQVYLCWFFIKIDTLGKLGSCRVRSTSWHLPRSCWQRHLLTLAERYPKEGPSYLFSIKMHLFFRHLRNYFGSKLFLPGDETSGNQTLWHVQPARGALWERLERKSSLVRRPFLNVYVNLIKKLNFRYNKPDYPWVAGRESPPFPAGPREGPVGHDGVPIQYRLKHPLKEQFDSLLGALHAAGIYLVRKGKPKKNYINLLNIFLQLKD